MLAFLYMLGWRLGKSVAEIRMLGTDELAGWLAFFELNPPDKLDRVLAARVAYYASRQFKKPPSFKSMMDEFDPPREGGEQTVHGQLAGMLAPPPDIAKRFKH